MTKFSLLNCKLLIILLCCIFLTSCSSYREMREQKRYKKCVVEFGNFGEVDSFPVYIEKEVPIEIEMPADSIFINDCFTDTVFKTEYLESTVKDGTVTTRIIENTLYDTIEVQIHDTIEVPREVNWEKPKTNVFKNSAKDIFIWLLVFGLFICGLLVLAFFIFKKWSL